MRSVSAKDVLLFGSGFLLGLLISIILFVLLF